MRDWKGVDHVEGGEITEIDLSLVQVSVVRLRIDDSDWVKLDKSRLAPTVPRIGDYFVRYENGSFLIMQKSMFESLFSEVSAV